MSGTHNSKHYGPPLSDEAVLDDPRWEKRAAGRATGDEVAALRALAERSGAGARAWRVFRPATDVELERLAQRVLPQPGTRQLAGSKEIDHRKRSELRVRTPPLKVTSAPGVDSSATTTAKGTVVRGLMPEATQHEPIAESPFATKKDARSQSFVERRGARRRARVDTGSLAMLLFAAGITAWLALRRPPVDPPTSNANVGQASTQADLIVVPMGRLSASSPQPAAPPPAAPSLERVSEPAVPVSVASASAAPRTSEAAMSRRPSAPKPPVRKDDSRCTGVGLFRQCDGKRVLTLPPTPALPLEPKRKESVTPEAPTPQVPHPRRLFD